MFSYSLIPLDFTQILQGYLTGTDKVKSTGAPFGLTLILPGISNYIHYKVWDEITYPFPNFNGVTIEVWDWICYFISHFSGH